MTNTNGLHFKIETTTVVGQLFLCAVLENGDTITRHLLPCSGDVADDWLRVEDELLDTIEEQLKKTGWLRIADYGVSIADVEN